CPASLESRGLLPCTPAHREKTHSVSFPVSGSPPVFAVRGRRPGPLDEGSPSFNHPIATDIHYFELFNVK
ncbi:MAG TPA: hypothetical protein VJ981_01885, partial [Gammaproteobacteria bacterium]|nr:hypothetical protein [Gammaproteobacteria bacterium]